MGVLAGEPIFGHKSDDTSRFEAVQALNDEKLDGLQTRKITSAKQSDLSKTNTTS